MFEINRDTMINDILEYAPESMPVFQNIGMHCLGCPSARGESLADACMVHGVDASEIENKINEIIAAN